MNTKNDFIVNILNAFITIKSNIYLLTANKGYINLYIMCK